MTIPDGALYPNPHSARFDFAATSRGAEWIDDLARRARARLRALPDGERVVAHGDWRIENLCVDAGRLAAVYDWDSVHAQREPVVLAPAATTFSVDWPRPSGHQFPSPTEIGEFMTDYQAARGKDFSPAERHVVAAAIVASLSYGARCEHADPGRPPAGDDSQRALLDRLGKGLLDRGLAVLEG